MKLKEKNITRQREFVYPDSYAYTIRERKTNKIIISEWSEEDAEQRLKELLTN